MKKLFFVLTVHSVLTSYAQDSLLINQLDEIVVTGQYEPQSAQQSVYNVRTIPMEVIRDRGAVKLEDILNTELNLRFSQDGATGTSRLSLQGISGQNIKILIDGAPLMGRQGISNEIDINQINVHTIERVEIVEGPMSTMYGADALAGVINIITRKPEAKTWSVTAGLLEKTVGNEYGLQKGVHNQNVGARYASRSWYAGLNAAKNYFGGWQGRAEGREKSWHPKDQIMADLQVGFKHAYYRMDYLYEDIYNPGPFQGVEALDEEYTTQRFMHQLQGQYHFSDKLNFTLTSAYTDYSRSKRTIVVEAASGNKTLSLGENAQSETRIQGISSRGVLVYKIHDKIAVQTGFDINAERGTGDRIRESNPGISDYAFFASVEWKPIPAIKIRPGLRMTYNSGYGAPPATPSVNTKWTLSKRNAIRLAYGRGFRAPSLRELYFNFFDSNHSIVGNSDLKAETSHSVNASWDWQAADLDRFRWKMTVGAFYNAAENKIDFGQKPNSTEVTYVNLSDYRTAGFTLRNTVHLRGVRATAGLSLTHILFWSPEVSSTFSYTIPKVDVSVNLYYKYTGRTPIYVVSDDSQDTDPAAITPFHTADLTLRKIFFSHLTVTAGVQNLFNVTVVNNLNNASASSSVHASSASTTPIGYGRSYFIGLTYTLERTLQKNKSFRKSNSL